MAQNRFAEFMTFYSVIFRKKNCSNNQGCGVGGKISDSNCDLCNFWLRLSKISDSDSWRRPFQTLRLQLLDIRGMKFGSLKSMRIVVHSKKSLLQQESQKKLYHINRSSQFRSVKKKNDPSGHPESDLDKTSDSDSQCC